MGNSRQVCPAMTTWVDGRIHIFIDVQICTVYFNNEGLLIRNVTSYRYMYIFTQKLQCNEKFVLEYEYPSEQLATQLDVLVCGGLPAEADNKIVNFAACLYGRK